MVIDANWLTSSTSMAVLRCGSYTVPPEHIAWQRRGTINTHGTTLAVGTRAVDLAWRDHPDLLGYTKV